MFGHFLPQLFRFDSLSLRSPGMADSKRPLPRSSEPLPRLRGPPSRQYNLPRDPSLSSYIRGPDRSGSLSWLFLRVRSSSPPLTANTGSTRDARVSILLFLNLDSPTSFPFFVSHFFTKGVFIKSVRPSPLRTRFIFLSLRFVVVVCKQGVKPFPLTSSAFFSPFWEFFIEIRFDTRMSRHCVRSSSVTNSIHVRYSPFLAFVEDFCPPLTAGKLGCKDLFFLLATPSSPGVPFLPPSELKERLDPLQPMWSGGAGPFPVPRPGGPTLCRLACPLFRHKRFRLFFRAA